MKKLLAAGTVLLIFLCPSITHGRNPEAGDRFRIPRIESPVKLDGLSNEAAWEKAASFPFVMQVPHYGNGPSERTGALMAFDDEYIYIAGRLYDSEPDKILAASKKRDSMTATSEWFGLIIDTFNDKENAMAFFTTPTGLRMDAAVSNDANAPPDKMPINISWNTFWDVASIKTEDGWFTEIRIPISSLRFQEENGIVVMGVIFWRWIARKAEVVVFPAFPQKWGMWSNWKPSRAQEIEFRGLRSQTPFIITPYLSGGAAENFDLNEEETAYARELSPQFELGLDLKYGLTSNMTLDITLNPDFAQVEADDQQINVTRFSLFFPEKRLFFQERSSNFEFNLGGPDQLFYSRRIGLYEGNVVRLYGGARIVGRAGSWDVGLLNLQTASFKDELPSENFGILRLRRRVFNPFSYVGGIVTSRIGTDGTYNVAYGLDGIFRLSENDYLTMKWSQTFETGAENYPLSLDPSRVSF